MVNMGLLFQVSFGIKIIKIFSLFHGYDVMKFSNDLFSSRKALNVLIWSILATVIAFSKTTYMLKITVVLRMDELQTFADFFSSQKTKPKLFFLKLHELVSKFETPLIASNWQKKKKKNRKKNIENLQLA